MIFGGVDLRPSDDFRSCWATARLAWMASRPMLRSQFGTAASMTLAMRCSWSFWMLGKRTLSTSSDSTVAMRVSRSTSTRAVNQITPNTGALSFSE
jgi:hypothetical protein